MVHVCGCGLGSYYVPANIVTDIKYTNVVDNDMCTSKAFAPFAVMHIMILWNVENQKELGYF